MNHVDRPVAWPTALTRWSSVAADVLPPAVIFLATLGPGQVLARHEPWPLLLQVVLVAPLAWRRRAPLTVFCVIAAAAAVQWVVGVQLPADAALLVALCAVGARRTWRQALTAGLVLEAGVLLAAWRWAPPGQFPFTVAALTAMVAAALTTGLWIRARQAYVTSLEHDREQRARLAVAEERARMTRDLHDIVTHNLSVMVALADSATYVRHRAPDQAAAAVERIADTGRQALADMRRALSGGGGWVWVWDGGGDGDGGGGEDRGGQPLQPAPGIAQLAPLAERMRAAGLPTRLEVTGDPTVVPATAQLTVYRLTQEALTNTLRHAPGATAEVRIHLTPGHADIEITDDGRAGRPSTTTPAKGLPDLRERVPSSGKGLSGMRMRVPTSGRGLSGMRERVPTSGKGLSGMRERVAAYGGTLDAGPLPGGGWRVAAALDLDADPADGGTPR